MALRLVVEREREIESFVPQEYWTIRAEFLPEGLQQSFVARLMRIDDQEVNLPNEAETQKVVAQLERANYTIARIKRGERRRRPSAPFITSTLQQEPHGAWGLRPVER